MKSWIAKTFVRISVLIFLFSFFYSSSEAQYVFSNDSLFKTGAANTGRLWGYAFGDIAYKTHSDSLTRGGSNQYTGIPQNRTSFQFRRIYLGYDYNISKKFSAELLLAAEDNFPAGNPPVGSAAGTTTALVPGNSTGDLLTDQKLIFYIKLLNLRWKNIWKGTDLVIGQAATPAFPMLTEKIWSYRSVERTISDIRRTPSFDMGVGLQGVFDPAKKNYGYNLMVANGTSAKPESDNFKWFYGDVYAYFFKKKIVVDAYADYQRMNWIPTWHHSRQMLKGYIAYNSSATEAGMNPGTGYTIGVEGFVNTLKNDNFAALNGGGVDTLTTAATGLSMYIHGDIIKNKLRFFIRYDVYNPNNKVNNTLYGKYSGNTGNYNDNSFHTTYNYQAATPTVTYVNTGDQTYKQQFFTAGLDFKPTDRVHFMPNIWYNSYASQVASNKNHDLVFRLTFFFAFGKNYDNGGF
ncbi:MAG TPA: hypothetical protein DIC22_09245 [Chitinophagaceae bacterium]|nr:hypothetical protein [Chitinophagaceae bacterium]